MLRDWNHCDDTLREIALLDLKVGGLASTRDKAMLDAEQKYKTASTPLLLKREQLADELEDFYRANRKEAESDGRRSKDLNFGRVGMRMGKPMLSLAKGWKWERVLDAIKASWRGAFLESLVTTKESVNKEGIKTRLDEEQMASVGLRLKQGDEFFFETFPEKVGGEHAA